MELKEKLIQYKDLTLEIIKSIENEEYDNIEKFIEMRQYVIGDLKKYEYDNIEFKKICRNFKLPLMEKKIVKLMNEKKSYIKNEMSKISKCNDANRSYNKKFSLDSIYFNKKI